MPTFVDIVHPETGDTGRAPERALDHLGKRGWVRAQDHSPGQPNDPTPVAPDPQPTPEPQPVEPDEFEDDEDDEDR